MNLILLILVLFSVTAHPDSLHYLKPTKLQTKTSPQTQRQAALVTIRNYLPDKYVYFDVKIDPELFSEEKDVFIVQKVQMQEHGNTISKILIQASSGVAAIWGFHHYLKQYCNSHLGWQVRNFRLDALPYVNETVVANDRIRYYQNVCTASYSFVWWSDKEWKDHIDWMAMNGVNLALAPLGQEEIWIKIYRELGMTEDEIEEHFTGPAFLSWLRMGNTRGWGGPLLPSWHYAARRYQTIIVDYMRNLGMIPVLPGFAGHVPRAFSRLFPNVTLYPMQQWNKFSDQYCCPLFVDPSDPLFRVIGDQFLKEITTAYGVSHVYNSDPFNEVKTSSWSTEFVERVGKEIFASLRNVDPQAVWLVQNWMFVHDPELWPRDRVQAFLLSVPRGRMLVLDLQSEQWPQYNAYDMYFGQPFVWCMLHNFGGTLGMFGNMEAIRVEVYRAREHEDSTMIGIGLTPEGINQNYVVYDLMLESAWRKQPVQDLDEWTAAYALRRYGCNSTSRAWRYLIRSVYNFSGLNRIRGKYVITRRPSLNIKPWAWYRSRDLFEAWKEFILATSDRCDSDAFRHDLVDLTRQVLQYRAEQLYVKFIENMKNNIWSAREIANQYLEVMNDIEEVLSTHENFQLYNWLLHASMSAEPGESAMYSLNARNQITLWGPNGEISDYACKQWAGMFQNYYIPRWRMFLKSAIDAKVRNEKFNEKVTQQVIRDEVEKKFATVDIKAPKYENSSESVAKIMFQKWYVLPDVDDLPLSVIWPDPMILSTMPHTKDEEDDLDNFPTVVLLHSTTPLT